MSNKMIELQRVEWVPERRTYPLLISLPVVTAVNDYDGNYNVYLGSTCFRITKDSYNKLCAALKAYKEDNVADKLCELQHDHTWSMQALANVLLMCKGDKTSYHPAILLGCYDKDLERMNEAVYEAVLGMQKHIKELEDEIKIMQETKRTSNT